MLLTPAIALMDRLNYPTKFMLISLVFAIPLFFFVWSNDRQLANQIAADQRELQGVQALLLLRPLIENLAKHRGMTSALLNGDSSFSDKVAIQSG